MDPSASSENSDAGLYACPICLNEANFAVVTRCGHIYCYACLRQWLASSRNFDCAVCHTPIDVANDLVPLYAGRQEGEDPRDLRSMSADIDKIRAEARARRQQERPRRRIQLGMNIGGFQVQFRDAPRLDEVIQAIFGGNGGAGENEHLDEPVVQRWRRVTRFVLTILFAVAWVILQLVASRPRVYVFGGEQR
ncbi:Zinc finger domain-containing protein [Giardia muris]|uniref:RING-type E3 ubiquitin transferase n=1 Tax=Giardia muris TaxID=5742 RepID=A0A4Z1SS74_GIAMU|nr:Zinc finger domain-containing protein [Giardia muris]|eukprot:TNJ26508.1 Zinc finger domain-containing protein [Giardia muris]